MNDVKPGYAIYRLTETSPDWEAVVRFVEEHDAEFVPPISSRMELTDYVYRFRSENGLMLAAVSEGRIAGCVGAFFRHPDRGTPFIQYVAVAMPFRRTGLCRDLISRAMEILQREGARRVETRTWSTNRASQAMLERLGFTLSERWVDDRAPGIDTVIFERLLP